MWAAGDAVREAGAWEITQGTSSRWTEGRLHVLLPAPGDGGTGRKCWQGCEARVGGPGAPRGWREASPSTCRPSMSVGAPRSPALILSDGGIARLLEEHSFRAGPALSDGHCWDLSVRVTAL